MVQKSGTASAPAIQPGRGKLAAFFALLGIVVVIAAIAGLLPRLARQKTIAAAAQEAEDRPALVNVTAARRASSKGGIELPGDLVAQIEAPIFARADGFVKRRLVDMGNTVKAGQLMAELETPELDQQTAQARATLAQSQSLLKELRAALALAQANLNLAKVTLDRWKRLTEKGVFARQEADEKQAAFAVRAAETQRAETALGTQNEILRSNEANLHRLEQMKAYSRVTAPFDGIVTSRTTDVGTLINSGNGGPSKEMFRVAQIDPLRVFVNVPQVNVSLIHAGQTAELRVQELPGQVFAAQVTSIANSLDMNSRSMLVYLHVQNPKHVLFPGMYAQVKFATPRMAAALVIPGDTVMMSKSGPRVAVVGTDRIVHYRNIAIANDLGSEVEVANGLRESEMVISNPTDAVREGSTVEVRNRAK
jgi:RND family efflux transporter MFP subunit